MFVWSEKYKEELEEKTSGPGGPGHNYRGCSSLDFPWFWDWQQVEGRYQALESWNLFSLWDLQEALKRATEYVTPWPRTPWWLGWFLEQKYEKTSVRLELLCGKFGKACCQLWHKFPRNSVLRRLWPGQDGLSGKRMAGNVVGEPVAVSGRSPNAEVQEVISSKSNDFEKHLMKYNLIFVRFILHCC